MLLLLACSPPFPDAQRWSPGHGDTATDTDSHDSTPDSSDTDDTGDSGDTGTTSVPPGADPQRWTVATRTVSSTVFTWFTTTTGQLSGPWRPLEGRDAWTGETEWWKGQVKQMMCANLDLLYVHRIPAYDDQRVNLFRALYELRMEGWDVPDVAPFLDPLITWDGTTIDVTTAAGKDALAGEYIRRYEQYYSVNVDACADDWIATRDGRPVLDSWHPHLNIVGYDTLTRADLQTRLDAALGTSHPVFHADPWMVTTAVNPTFSFSDEKDPQFEVTEYSYSVEYNGLTVTQLKGGYWDQNVRTGSSGSILPREGGAHFREAWANVDASRVDRVYVESFNEYDEGSGIYAASVGPPYTTADNPSNDTWSSGADPFEYLRTTASGAAAFNETPTQDARVLSENLPRRGTAGSTVTATVVVRNEGDSSWTGAALYGFGEKLEDSGADLSPTGLARWYVDDAGDEIPTYGGIFRGRPTTFTLTLRLPDTPGSYPVSWGMLQEGVAWFGEELSYTLVVE